jgi:pimeloyl-ACP methyl ester carboxylesterase
VERSIAIGTGVALRYVERGDPRGVPVVLVHGPTDSWRSWEPLLGHLPQSIRAFAITQRGHGDGPRPDSGYRPADFAADLVAFMDATGLPAAVLVGHSAAGFTLGRVAAAHPACVTGLVLIASPPALTDIPAFAAFDERVQELRDPLDPAFVRDFVVGTSAPSLPSAFLDLLVEEARKVPAAVWAQTFAALRDERLDAERIACPALLLWGDRDPIVGRGAQEALLRAMPRAELTIYPGAGHSPHWEHPQRSAGAIATFALRLSGAAASPERFRPEPGRRF